MLWQETEQRSAEVEADLSFVELSFVTKREPEKWSSLRVDHPEVEPVALELILWVYRALLVSSCLICLHTLAPLFETAVPMWERKFTRYDSCQLEPSDKPPVWANLRYSDLRYKKQYNHSIICSVSWAEWVLSPHFNFLVKWFIGCPLSLVHTFCNFMSLAQLFVIPHVLLKNVYIILSVSLHFFVISFVSHIIFCNLLCLAWRDIRDYTGKTRFRVGHRRYSSWPRDTRDRSFNFWTEGIRRPF